MSAQNKINMITPQDKAEVNEFIDGLEKLMPQQPMTNEVPSPELAEYKVRLSVALEDNRRLRAILVAIRQETLKGLSL